MTQSTKSDLEKYIDKLTDRCNCNNSQIEEVVLTQIALLLSDLAVTKNCDIMIGELKVDDNNSFKFTPNDFLLGILSNKIDPLLLLNEFIKRT